MELALYHLLGTETFEVAHRFLEKFVNTCF